jgi:hypothetical protein
MNDYSSISQSPLAGGGCLAAGLMDHTDPLYICPICLKPIFPEQHSLVVETIHIHEHCLARHPGQLRNGNPE